MTYAESLEFVGYIYQIARIVLLVASFSMFIEMLIVLVMPIDLEIRIPMGDNVWNVTRLKITPIDSYLRTNDKILWRWYIFTAFSGYGIYAGLSSFIV